MSDNEDYSCPADDYYSDDGDWDAPVFFKNPKSVSAPPPPRRMHFGTRHQRFQPSTTAKAAGSSINRPTIERKITKAPTPAASPVDKGKAKEEVEEKVQAEDQTLPPAKRGPGEEEEDDGQISQKRKKPRTSED